MNICEGQVSSLRVFTEVSATGKYSSQLDSPDPIIKNTAKKIITYENNLEIFNLTPMEMVTILKPKDDFKDYHIISVHLLPSRVHLT